MKSYNNTVLSDATGLSVVGAQITVYQAGTKLLSTLFKANDPDGDTLPNPFKSDEAGEFQFFAVDGRYDIYVSYGARAGKIIRDVELVNVLDYLRRLEAVENGEPGAVGSLRSDLALASGASIVRTGDGKTVEEALAVRQRGFASLAEMKAASVLDTSYVLASAAGPIIYAYVAGNFSGQADDLVVVKLNAVPLTTGALKRQGAASISYSGGGTADAALVRQDAKLARTVYVTDAPYNAVGNGVADDSAAIMACINANKGATIILPQGKTFLAAATSLSGPSYNNTTLIVEGTYRMKPSGGAANFGGQSPFFGGIIVHDCDGVTIDIPGIIDGNRLAQTQWQQHHAVVFWGATNFAAPRINARELRGDAVYISSKTNTAPLIKNSTNGIIGSIVATNTDYDGRNALSIVSGDNIIVGSVLSTKIGGVINGERMPGGVDIEPDGAWHIVRRIRIASAVIDCQGTSGVAVIGHSVSENDAAEDWNCQDVQFDDFSVYNPIATALNGATGGPIFKRALNLKVSGSFTMGQRGNGFTFDYIKGLVADIRAVGCNRGALFAPQGIVRNFDVRANVLGHSGAAVQTTAIRDGTLQILTREPQGAGSYGVQLADLGRGITQTNVKYDVDIPFDQNLSAAILVSSVILGEGTHVTGRMTGYIGTAGAGLQFSGGVIPTKLIEGRNIRAALPTAGIWLQREQVWFTAPAAGAAPGAICVQTGDFAGAAPVFKAMAALAA